MDDIVLKFNMRRVGCDIVITAPSEEQAELLIQLFLGMMKNNVLGLKTPPTVTPHSDN